MPHKFASALVVKFGGNAMGPQAEAALAAQVAELQRSGQAVVVVHGGGPEIDRALSAAGIVTERVHGLRATPAPALEVTESVLCGRLNKRLVRVFSAAGIPAAGISGMDGRLLQARRVADLGFVGEIERVETGLLEALLDGGYVPVVAPLALESATYGALNVNADTAAGAIAGAMQAQAFALMTNVPRVRADANDAASGIDRMSLPAARSFAASAACEGSMRPKIQAAIDAVAAGAKMAAIGDAQIAAMLAGNATIIT